MRLRLAVHHGYIWADDRGWVGSAINMATRLVNSDAARAALRDNPAAQLAVIVGEELHRDVVMQDHPSIAAEDFVGTRARTKNVDVPAWISVAGGGGAADVAATDGRRPDMWIVADRVGNVIHGDVTVGQDLIGINEPGA
jgi:hypothetical protein